MTVPDRYASDELFQQLLRREIRIRRVWGIVSAVILGVVLGVVAMMAIVSYSIRESFELGREVTATVEKVLETEANSSRVSYRYSVRGKSYTGTGRIVGGPAPAVGDKIEARVAALTPGISQIPGDTLLSALGVPLGLMAGLFTLALLLSIPKRRRVREQHRRLREVLDAAVLHPEGPAALYHMIDVGEQEYCGKLLAAPMERWDVWRADPVVSRLLQKWVAAQPCPVNLREFLGRLHEADLAFNPRQTTELQPRATAPTVFFSRDDLFSADDPPPLEYQRWQALANGVADAMTLDLTALNEQASRREWEEHRRKAAAVEARVRSRLHLTLGHEDSRVKEELEKAGLVREWPPAVPLRHTKEGVVVSEQILTAPEALALMDSTLLRFGFLPQPPLPIKGTGVMTAGKDEAPRLEVKLSYRPGTELRVAANNAPAKG